jgi:myo-inositol-1(or 4)-monophosphatase
MLQTAIEAARRAGRVLAERYPAARTLTVKGYRDIVTDADTAAETVILDLIRARFPDHIIISEEAGGSEISSGYTWIVDPLDGTTNYAHHVPVFAVSIGVLEGGEPLIGVIYDPLRDQTFVAERGGGARLNETPIHASRVVNLGHTAIHASRVVNLGHTVVGLDWGHSDEVRGRVLACLHRVAPRCGTVRALGSATLALAYVAAGWLDGYFNLALKPWDTAAGILIVAEAGGRCSTLEGEPYRVDLPGCLATNGRIHGELLGVMRGT